MPRPKGRDPIPILFEILNLTGLIDRSEFYLLAAGNIEPNSNQVKLQTQCAVRNSPLLFSDYLHYFLYPYKGHTAGGKYPAGCRCHRLSGGKCSIGHFRQETGSTAAQRICSPLLFLFLLNLFPFIFNIHLSIEIIDL